MRLNKYLTEIKITRKVKFYDKRKNDESWEVKFDIEGKMYTFTVEYEITEDIWKVFFMLGKGETLSTFLKGIKISGTGDAIKVFGAVTQALKMFIKEKKPARFSIASGIHEPSRMKLYDKFMPQIKKLTGYKFIESYIDIDDKVWVYEK
jgi:hypothetical protein